MRVVRFKVLTSVVLSLVAIFLFLLLLLLPCVSRSKHVTFTSNRDGEQVRQVFKGLFPVNLAPSRKLNTTADTQRSDLTPSSNGRYYLTVIPRGRLGNQMFEYASLLGIADVNNRVPFVSSSCKVTHYFSNVSVSDRPVSSWTIMEEATYAEKDSVFDSLPPSNIRLKGFFQSWKYFANLSHKVKRSFLFVSDVEEAVHGFYVNYTHNLGDDVIKIGVHVRRTDMLQRVTQKQGYVSAPLSYLQKAIHHMRIRFGNASTFFVVSDDSDWCRQKLTGLGVVVVDPAPSAVHLGFLTRCDHVIMTVGTFGWWAAYLAGGHVVYYGNFPRADSEIADGFRKEDFYLPHWTAIGD